MRRHSRHFAGRVTLFFSALLAPALVVLAPPASLPVAAATPKCQSASLVVWLNTDGDGAAGSVYYQLEFTNLSGHACTLTGYPGVSAIGLSAQQIGTAASRVNAHPVRLVTLANGAAAKATLQISDALNYSNSTCRRTMAGGLRIYPPGQVTAKTVPFPFLACSRSGTHVLSVESVLHA